MEVPAEARQHRRKEDVGDKGHDGNIHVGRVEIIARREEHGRILLLGDLAVGAWCCCCEACLLARPWLMSPWEKDEKEFIQDVGVGDVEVVFERGDRDVAIEL